MTKNYWNRWQSTLQAAEVFHGNQVTYTPQGFVSAVQAAGGVLSFCQLAPKN